eukprot:gene2097-2584_t
MTVNVNEILTQQQKYYNERAEQYDLWWNKVDKWDSGEDFKKQDLINKEEIYDFLGTITKRVKTLTTEPVEVLELAPGTGNFTQWFFKQKDVECRVTCEEGSNEMINVLKRKLEGLVTDSNFSVTQTDLFSDKFQPKQNFYDIVFLGFFISHIPPSLFQSFFAKCLSALKPNGKIIFVESYYPENYQKKYHESGATNRINLNDELKDQDYIIDRKLLNGDVHKIIKIGFSVEHMISVLSASGFTMRNGDMMTVNSSYFFGSHSKP